MVAGLAATWAMSEVQRVWTRAVDGRVPDSAGGKHDARDWQERSEHRNSNELAAAGLGFGAALWLVADVVAMPLLGLSRPTTRRRLEMHLQSLAAHLVYGITTELVRHPAGGLLTAAEFKGERR